MHKKRRIPKLRRGLHEERYGGRRIGVDNEDEGWGVEGSSGDGRQTGLISGLTSPRTKGIKSRATTTFVRWASRNSKSW